MKMKGMHQQNAVCVQMLQTATVTGYFPDERRPSARIVAQENCIYNLT